MTEKTEYAVGDKVVVTGFKLSRPNRPGEHYYGTNEAIEKWVSDQRALTVVRAVYHLGDDGSKAVEALSEDGVSYLFHPSELRLVEAPGLYPKTARPNIDQFAEHIFVWYDEAGLVGGAANTLAAAEAELLAYGRSLEHVENAITVQPLHTLDFAEIEARVMGHERDNRYRSLLIDALSMLKDLSLGYDMSGLHRGLEEVLADARALGIDTEEL